MVSISSFSITTCHSTTNSADTFHPFKSGIKIEKIAAYTNKFYSTETDISAILPDKYKDLTADNFFFKNIRTTGDRSGGAAGFTTSSMTYNNSTGILTATAASRLTGGGDTTFSVFEYYEIWVVYIDE